MGALAGSLEMPYRSQAFVWYSVISFITAKEQEVDNFKHFLFSNFPKSSSDGLGQILKPGAGGVKPEHLREVMWKRMDGTFGASWEGTVHRIIS